MNAAELKKILQIARKFNLKSLKIDSVEIHFRPNVSRETKKVSPLEGINLSEFKTTGERMPSDDEMLYYSADSPIQVPKS